MTADDDTDPLDAFDDLPPHDPHRDHAVLDDALHPKYDWQVFDKPIEGFEDGLTDWYLGWVGICKAAPRHRHGFGGSLWPESRFYKRWFDVREGRGWMIIFRLWDRHSNVNHPGLYETLAGWVPPERVKEADHWIAFLNHEIRARLRESGQTPKEPDPAHGAMPPPVPPGPVPVPRLIESAPPSKLFPAGVARTQKPDKPAAPDPPPPSPPSPLPPATARRRR